MARRIAPGIIAQWSHNPGPISCNTLAELQSRNIPVDTNRYPMQVTAADFSNADLVIALYDTEHRSMMENYFPDHLPAVEFWNVPDLNEMDSTDALALIDKNIRSLIDQFLTTPYFFDTLPCDILRCTKGEVDCGQKNRAFGWDAEWSMPPRFLQEVNRRNEGVIAEFVKLAARGMDEPCEYSVLSTVFRTKSRTIVLI